MKFHWCENANCRTIPLEDNFFSSFFIFIFNFFSASFPIIMFHPRISFRRAQNRFLIQILSKVTGFLFPIANYIWIKFKIEDLLRVFCFTIWTFNNEIIITFFRLISRTTSSSKYSEWRATNFTHNPNGSKRSWKNESLCSKWIATF